MIGTKLYKKDSKGKIRVWTLEVFTTDDGTFMKTTSGLKDGKFTERIKEVKDSKVKTAHVRAMDLASNDYIKKLREGYYKTEEQAKNCALVKPMLAKTFEGTVENLTFPIAVQPKINGVRCLYSYDDDKLYSRGLLEYVLPEIKKWARAYCEVTGISYLDGELYIPGEKVGDILSAVKTLDNPKRGLIEYHLYDCILDDDSVPFKERIKAFGKSVLPARLVLVPTAICLHPHEVERFYKSFLEAGWEGLMIRDLKCRYEYKRTAALLKWKPVFSVEVPVVGYRYIVERGATPLDPIKHLVMFECLFDGKPFDVVPAWSHDKRHQWYVDHRGMDIEDVCSELDPLTIEYRELTAYGVPHHAVGIAFRPEGY